LMNEPNKFGGGRFHNLKKKRLGGREHVWRKGAAGAGINFSRKNLGKKSDS